MTEVSIRDSWKTPLELSSKHSNHSHSSSHLLGITVLKPNSKHSSATITDTPSSTMSSNDSASTLQSAIDSVKGAAQSVLGAVTGKEADQVSSTPLSKARQHPNIFGSKKPPTTKTKPRPSRTPRMRRPKSAISPPLHPVPLSRTTPTAPKARGTKQSERVRR